MAADMKFDPEVDDDEQFVEVKRAVGTIFRPELDYANRIEEFADGLCRKYTSY